MRQFALIFFSFFVVLSANAQVFLPSGGVGVPFEYKGNLGDPKLSAVTVFNTFAGATLTYESIVPGLKFFMYDGTSETQILSPHLNASPMGGGKTRFTILNLQSAVGYMVKSDADVLTATWVVDINGYLPALHSISTVDGGMCEDLKLLIDKSDELPYYTTFNARRVLPRQYTISYETMEWSKADEKFVTKSASKSFSNIGTEIMVAAPLKDTRFTIGGDSIANHFGKKKEVSSALYEAVAVKSQRLYLYYPEGAPNVPTVKEDQDKFEGSAPIATKFFGYGNDPITRYYTWLIFKKEDMRNPVARYTDQNIDYLFDTSGEFVVMLETANRMSTCADTSRVEVKIYVSDLKVPNFFSPGDSPGVNDEFRVYHKSLIQFKCTIFNRWGVKLYEWNDPSKGWDGRSGGRIVNTGVYYYVIIAKGSDGRNYKMMGDINILRGK